MGFSSEKGWSSSRFEAPSRKLRVPTGFGCPRGCFRGFKRCLSGPESIWGVQEGEGWGFRMVFGGHHRGFGGPRESLGGLRGPQGRRSGRVQKGRVVGFEGVLGVLRGWELPEEVWGFLMRVCEGGPRKRFGGRQSCFGSLRSSQVM